MNQRDEQRVIDALGALTGGLIVTEQEILSAHGRLRTSLEPPSPTRRPLMIVAAAAAVAAIIGLVLVQVVDRDDASPSPAPAPPTPAETLESALQANAYGLLGEEFTAGAPVTAQDLPGIWLLRSPFSEGPLVVDGDGDWAFTGFDRDAVFASSTLAGDTWTRHLDSAFWTRHGDCPAMLPWTAAIADDGSLRLSFTGRVNQCTMADDREVWDRLTPGPSPVADFLRDASADIDWTTPTDGTLKGIYFSPETGELLEVVKGSYWSYDTVTTDDVTPAEQGELTRPAESGTIEGSCSGGTFAGTLQVGSTPEVSGLMESHQAIKVTSSGGACNGGIGAGGVWVKLS